MATVFVISRDWMLRAGLRAQLREEHIEAAGMESADDAGTMIAQGVVPSLIVFEATTNEPEAALGSLTRRIPVVVVSSRSQRIAPLPGAAAVLYRPVRIADIVATVEKLLRGQAA
jgi:DNA-binding response OmpR family regulator